MICWDVYNEFVVFKYQRYLFTALFTNIVTFRKEDATIQFPTFEAGDSGDIRFQFMTTAMDGILLQNTGPYDFIEVRLVCEFIITLNHAVFVDLVHLLQYAFVLTVKLQSLF